MEIRLPFQPSKLTPPRRNEPFQLINDPSLRYRPNVQRISYGKRLIPVYPRHSSKGDIYLDSDISTSRSKPNSDLGKKTTDDDKAERDDGGEYIELIRFNKGAPRNREYKNSKPTYIHEDIILEPKYISHNQMIRGNRQPYNLQQGHLNTVGAAGPHPPRFGIPRFPIVPGPAEQRNDQQFTQQDEGDKIGEFGDNSMNEFRDPQPWYFQSTFVFFFLGILLVMVIGGIAIYYIAA
ncbi:signal peptide plus transmembrane domain or GPI anchor [Cryptosporidium felis]|nr:signal peptide plus transmembrane domain or GPI anchor [Cryptosporidium felis]